MIKFSNRELFLCRMFLMAFLITFYGMVSCGITKRFPISIMPARGLSFDRAHWVHAGKKNDFFVHYKVLSRKFRGKFRDMLQNAKENNQLVFKGDISYLSVGKSFTDFTWKLKKVEWVVIIQRPLGSPPNILGYLLKYVFRVATAS
jgi:hypothetical protein